MESQAYFTGIRAKIIEHLLAATNSVMVAVAWLTDRELFDELVACQRRGVPVSLAVLDVPINRKSSIAWERLTALGGKLCWIPESRAGSLHHKFCLIDGDTVINGSFNWTNRASNADENIIVMQGDLELAAQFLEAFNGLLGKHGHAVEPLPIDRAKLMTRLAVIARLLELEDHEDIPAQAKKMAHAKSLPEVAELLDLLSLHLWIDAQARVKDILGRGLAIVAYIDPRIEEWRWQARVMERQVMALEAELADMQRQIHLFDHQQDQAIGELIREYLDVKRRALHAQHKRTKQVDSREAAKDADETYERYEKARAAQANEPKPQQLDMAQQADLKALYRKLAQRCHPDRMKDGDKDWATAVFKDLQAAYQMNDLATMQRLQSQIERGPGSDQEFQIPDQADLLQVLISGLQRTIASLSQHLAAIVQSATWQTLSQEPDWSDWFARKGEQLREEIQRYQAELDKSLAEEIV